MNILEKIKNCTTLSQLGGLRIDCVRAAKIGNGEIIQKAFIKQRNKLARIPLKDREW
jgi:hypothetical protein